MTNDTWTGETSDEYRTAEFELGLGEYSLGWNLYTTSPNKQEYEQQVGGNSLWESPIWRSQQNNVGTYSNVTRVFSGFYFGFKAFNGNYSIGHDGAWSQDFFQNGLHKKIESPYVNSNLNPSSNLFFQYYRNQNA